MFGFPSRSRSSAARVEPRVLNASPESPTTSLDNPDPWLEDWARGAAPGTFGPAVNEQSAMRVSTVFACVNVMAGLLAAAPLGVYRDTPNKGREIQPRHRLYPLLHTNPYPGRVLTAAAWKRLWASHVLLWGDAFSVIRYDNAARVVGFEPAMPWYVDVLVNAAGRKLYVVRWPSAAVEAVSQDDMLHFMGPSFDGVRGLSRIKAFARDPIALSALLQEQTGRVHENAARPSGMLTLPPKITPDGKRRIEAHWAERHQGRSNAGSVVFADPDSKYTPFQLTPEDLHTLETRRYQSADICRFFGMPPHMVGEAAGTSAWGTGIEQLTLGFMQFTLDPFLHDLEGELRLKLFEASDFYPAFNRDSLVAMDAKTTAEVAQIELQSGVLLLNERRRAKQRPDVEGGDEPLVNANLIPLRRALTNSAPVMPKKGR